MNELLERPRDYGYLQTRELPDGSVIGLRPMITTWSICVDLNRAGYRTRYCYGDLIDALIAFVEWNGVGDPSGSWIVQKPEGRQGPGSAERRA